MSLWRNMGKLLVAVLKLDRQIRFYWVQYHVGSVNVEQKIVKFMHGVVINVDSLESHKIWVQSQANRSVDIYLASAMRITKGRAFKQSTIRKICSWEVCRKWIHKGNMQFGYQRDQSTLLLYLVCETLQNGHFCGPFRIKMGRHCSTRVIPTQYDFFSGGGWFAYNTFHVQ